MMEKRKESPNRVTVKTQNESEAKCLHTEINNTIYPLFANTNQSSFQEISKT